MPDTTTRTVLITGCSSGIGLCMVRGLCSRGYHLIAYRMYQRWIDKQNSAHRAQYGAVLTKVVHALESRRPKIRYYVTVPTYLFGALRRLLPFRMLEGTDKSLGRWRPIVGCTTCSTLLRFCD